MGGGEFYVTTHIKFPLHGRSKVSFCVVIISDLCVCFGGPKMDALISAKFLYSKVFHTARNVVPCIHCKLFILIIN